MLIFLGNKYELSYPIQNSISRRGRSVWVQDLEQGYYYRKVNIGAGTGTEIAVVLW